MSGKMVTVIVDRPLGSFHPEYKELRYPLNYGYIEGEFSLDGEEMDAYILGVDVPLCTFRGKVIAIIHRLDDIEDKLVVAPEDAVFSKEEVISHTAFVEQYFQIEVQMV